MKRKILYLPLDESSAMELRWILEDLGLDGVELDVVQTLGRLGDILIEEEIVLIIIDTYIPAIHDLAPIGKPEVDTLEGSQAGFAILQHLLRKKNSPYRGIPVLILTVKTLTKEEKSLMKKLKIEGYIELSRPGWRKKFSEFINRYIR